MTALRQTVLVAEDDALIRMVAADALADAGFQVLEAEHAEAALVLLAAGAASIHAIFTDIQMPGTMNGLALAHHARLHWPWIVLLVASGNMKPTVQDMPTGSDFLAKPYQPACMIECIHHLLRQQPLADELALVL